MPEGIRHKGPSVDWNSYHANPFLLTEEEMARLKPGMLHVVLGVVFLSIGAATTFALAWLFYHLDVQLSLTLYLVSSSLTVSGFIPTFYGARRLMPAHIPPFPTFPPYRRGPYRVLTESDQSNLHLPRRSVRATPMLGTFIHHSIAGLRGFEPRFGAPEAPV
ncbi:MAG: hypothetical protein ACE5JE_09715, partial [Thermoplasmata archaeon]